MLNGKTAFVTGGARGMGRAIVTSLVKQGARVAFTYLSSEQKAAELVSEMSALGGMCHAIRADNRLADELKAAVQDAFEKLGALDIVVNNAGSFMVAPIDQMTVEQFDESLFVNLRSGFVVSKSAVPLMNEHGRIIFIGSNLASQAKFGGLAAYSASKAGVSGLTHALARELGARSITVNAIHPGSTDTDMNPADGPMADGQRALMARPEYINPEEIGGLVLYLASDAAKSVTGADIVIDNGTNT